MQLSGGVGPFVPHGQQLAFWPSAAVTGSPRRAAPFGGPSAHAPSTPPATQRAVEAHVLASGQKHRADNRVRQAELAKRLGSGMQQSGSPVVPASPVVSTLRRTADAAASAWFEEHATSRLTIGNDVVRAVDDVPRSDILDAIRSGLEAQSSHPALQTFPVEALIEKIDAIRALFRKSNARDDTFRDALSDVLLFFQDFLNSAPIAHLLGPYKQHLAELRAHSDAAVGDQETALARDDMAARKHAFMIQLRDLRELCVKLREMATLVSNTEAYNAKLLEIRDVRERSIARLAETRSRTSKLNEDASADVAKVKELTAEVEKADEAARAAFAAKEAERVEAQAKRHAEQEEIVAEIAKLMERFASVQDEANRTAQELHDASVEEETRRADYERRRAHLGTRLAALERLVSNSSVAGEIGEQMTTLVEFWCKAVADSVAGKQVELDQTGREVHVEQSQVYNDFYLVCQRLLHVMRERRDKLKRQMAHCQAEKELAVSMLDQTEVDKWVKQCRQCEREMEILDAEYAELSGAFEQEQAEFRKIEAQFDRLDIAYESPEALWEKELADMRSKQQQNELRRLETWQMSFAGTLSGNELPRLASSAGKEAPSKE